MKKYILLISFLIVSCTSPSERITVLPQENRPNIILILADDLDEKLGTTQYMVNLKSLLKDHGTSIENFLITTPMCCPSRINLFLSQFTHNHQVYNNEAPDGGFPKFYETGRESSTIAVWLQAAGYRTALIGKYMNAYPLQDNRTYVPPGWTEWYSPARKNAYDGYDYYLNENGTLIPYPPTQENYFTDVQSAKAVDFIKRAKVDNVPFFLYLSPFAPHEPAVAATRHLELLPDIQAPRTPSFNEADVSDKPYNLSANPLLDEEDMKRIDEIYRNRVLSMLAVDEMIAQIINTLEETQQIENTYVIFTSDQGFHLGQHRLLQGKSSFYEEDIVVPFTVRGPNIPEGHQIQNVLTGIIDIAPTILDWAGVVPPDSVVGQSFASILQEQVPPETWRDVFYLETYAFSEEDALFENKANINLLNFFSVLLPQKESALPRWAGLRTLEYTYISHPDGFIELYNLQNDPYQIDNLATVTDPTILAMFAERVKDLGICEGQVCRQLLSLPLGQENP